MQQFVTLIRVFAKTVSALTIEILLVVDCINGGQTLNTLPLSGFSLELGL